MGAPAISSPRTPPRRRTRATTRTGTATRTRTRNRNARARSGADVIRFPVNAVGRTAATVGGLADSGVVVGMARSRLWIGVLGVLLGGIVAINVVGLSLSSSESRTASQVDELVRSNSVQQSRLAHRLSNGQISRKAAALGLAVPTPDAVRYIDAGGNDAERAAERLADGEITNAPPALTAPEADTAGTTTEPTIPPVDPAVTATTDPAAAVMPPATTSTDPALAPVTTP